MKKIKHKVVHVPNITNDREDWIESNIQYVTASKNDECKVKYVTDNRYIGKKNEVLTGVLSMGNVLKGAQIYPNVEQVKKSIKYWETETFKRYCGREYTTCFFTPGDMLETCNKLNLSKYFIKYVAQLKSMPNCVIINDGSESPFYDGFGLFLVSHESRKISHEVLIQEHVELKYEYRIVVIDGKPICGAGCIEEFSPLENKDTWDCQMRKDRANVSNLETKFNIRNKYQVFADKVCGEFKQEGLLDYVLDVALDKYYKPVIIELNPPFNFGMYAMDYEQVFNAILDTVDERK